MSVCVRVCVNRVPGSRTYTRSRLCPSACVCVCVCVCACVRVWITHCLGLGCVRLGVCVHLPLSHAHIHTVGLVSFVNLLFTFWFIFFYFLNSVIHFIFILVIFWHCKPCVCVQMLGRVRGRCCGQCGWSKSDWRRSLVNCYAMSSAHITQHITSRHGTPRSSLASCDLMWPWLIFTMTFTYLVWPWLMLSRHCYYRFSSAIVDNLFA